MLTMAEIWIDIEKNVDIINGVVDADLYAIDDQGEEILFCIYYDREYENYFLIVPDEENNYTQMEIMNCLDNIQ